MKKCIGCGMLKDISEYHKHPGMTDGHINKCKECVRKYSKENRLARLPAVQEQDRIRSKLKRQSGVQYNKVTEWRNNNPEKYLAQTAVGNAIRDGRLTKLPCVVCGSIENIHGHHDDYSRPLDVVWLCPFHHGERHRMLNNGTP